MARQWRLEFAGALSLLTTRRIARQLLKREFHRSDNFR